MCIGVSSAHTSLGVDTAAFHLSSRTASSGGDDKDDGLHSAGKAVDTDEVRGADNLFHKYNSHGSGMFDAEEVKDYLHSVRAPRSQSWESFDVDEDGVLSKREFQKLNLAVRKIRMDISDADRDLSSLLDFEEKAGVRREVPEEFHDIDDSFSRIRETLDHFLDEEHADPLTKHLPAGVHWRAFDTNFDGHLSHTELAKLLSSLDIPE
eukprot:TRINITY_DN3046_c0_g1_i3.p1 TRINITY_DN3046_c0_g1~~TRINITY_DN3046_c0_g1_i3.p1  ORF type:complete len:208 (-),score=43.55 TRINITY_DN3046_c0_g1_i3:109-732(-)